MTTDCPSFVYRDATSYAASAGPATDVVPLPTCQAGDLLVMMGYGSLSFVGLTPFWNVWQATSSFSGDIFHVTRICDGTEPATFSFTIAGAGPLERVYLAMSCAVSGPLYPYSQDMNIPPFPDSGWSVGTQISAGIVAPGSYPSSSSSSDEEIVADAACGAATMVAGLFARGVDMSRGTPTGFDNQISVAHNGVIFGTLGILTRFVSSADFGQVTDTLVSGTMDTLTEKQNVWCPGVCTQPAWFSPPPTAERVPPWERNIEQAIGRRSFVYRKAFCSINIAGDLVINGITYPGGRLSGPLSSAEIAAITAAGYASRIYYAETSGELTIP